jgi:hypothetical protein
VQWLSPFVLAIVTAMTPQIAALPALPENVQALPASGQRSVA